MFTKSIKTVLAAGVLVLGAAATSAPANAGSSFGVYVGNGHGSAVYFGNGGRHSPTHYRGGRRHHGYGHYAPRRHFCGPRRAVNKAYRWGMDHPRVKRINNRRVVVVGWNRGHPAKMVFSRHGRGCPLIKARGI